MLSGRLLPAHPKPLPDELLSSWIVRIAEANGIKLHTLIRILLPEYPDPWMRDIDRHSPAWLRQKFVSLTATPYSTIRKTSLATYEGHIFPRQHPSGQLRWILPLKVRSSRRFGYGVQYCPECLATDFQPYFRRKWRLGFVTFCPEHNVMMRDACPECGVSIAIHRRDFEKEIDQALRLSDCNKCGFDLSTAQTKSPVTFDAPAFQQYAQLARRLKWPKARKRSVSLEYFSVLHQLCKILVSSRNNGVLEHHICQRLGIAPQIGRKGKSPFEQRRVGERYFVVSLALWLMGDLDQRLVDAWEAKAVRFNLLLRDFWDQPEWFKIQSGQLNRLENRTTGVYRGGE